MGLAVEERGEEVEVLEEGYLLLWWWEEVDLASVAREVKDCIFAALGGCFREIVRSRRKVPRGGDI